LAQPPSAICAIQDESEGVSRPANLVPVDLRLYELRKNGIRARYVSEVAEVRDREALDLLGRPAP